MSRTKRCVLVGLVTSVILAKYGDNTSRIVFNKKMINLKVFGRQWAPRRRANYGKISFLFLKAQAKKEYNT